LKQQYPDQTIDVHPAAIGNKMMAIARKELQYNNDDAMDAIQDFLTYLVSSKFDFTKETEKGRPGAATWKKALDNIYSNLRLKAMSGSFKKFKKGESTDEDKLAHFKWKKEESQKEGSKFSWGPADEKSLKALEKKVKDAGKDPASIAPKQLKRKNIRDKTIDEAFGKRPEGGGAAEGGEARVPTGEENMLGKALDDKAALKEFYDLIDEYLPDLKKSLSKDTGALFDLVFEQDVGTFGSDIKENMGQATALKENYPEVWKDFEDKWGGKVKNLPLKWSAYVGELRKRLLEEIWDFIDENMSPNDFQVLRDEFFSDITPEAVEKAEGEKIRKKQDYQRGIDLRKVLKARKEGKTDDPKYKNLVKKLELEMKKEGKKLEDELAAEAKKGGGAAAEEEGQEAQAQVAFAIATRIYRAWS